MGSVFLSLHLQPLGQREPRLWSPVDPSSSSCSATYPAVCLREVTQPFPVCFLCRLLRGSGRQGKKCLLQSQVQGHTSPCPHSILGLAPFSEDAGSMRVTLVKAVGFSSSEVCYRIQIKNLCLNSQWLITELREIVW